RLRIGPVRPAEPARAGGRAHARLGRARDRDPRPGAAQRGRVPRRRRLCGGDDAAVPLALRLANRVIADLGAEGRLYSTVDSVAAIALMAELQAAKILASGGGHVLVDGRRRTVS